MEAKIAQVSDFELNGRGDHPGWKSAHWLPLALVGGEGRYESRAKLLWSERGIYFFFDCEDHRLTCTQTHDFDDIFKEDVVEVFLWPDEASDIYFEYEIAPLGAELPILITNHEGKFMGWRPWHYEGDRKTRRAVQIVGGQPEPGASVERWTAEFFIPFALFRGLGNSPPEKGTRWRANFYRIDYDKAPAAHWAWCPATGANFHRFREFGTIEFG